MEEKMAAPNGANSGTGSAAKAATKRPAEADEPAAEAPPPKASAPDEHDMAGMLVRLATNACFESEHEKQSRRQETRELQLSHLQQEIERPSNNLPPELLKFLSYAECHRTLLNQMLRSAWRLDKPPFSILVDHAQYHLLDFDVKQRYFRNKIDKASKEEKKASRSRIRTEEEYEAWSIRQEDVVIQVNRERVFEDSFRGLHRRSPEEWKKCFQIDIVSEGKVEVGKTDWLNREWYDIISREISNPMYGALFTTLPGDRLSYKINPHSHFTANHLSYFKFVGHVIAKAIYDDTLFKCYFTRSFYKHILGKCVRYTDMESEDYPFYQDLAFLVEHKVAELGYDLTFSTEVQEFGVTEARDLKPNGSNIIVTEDNKMEYIQLVTQMKMMGGI